MGRVRTTQIKRIGKMLVEKYQDKLTTDFEKNKKIIEELVETYSKRIRNQIAGYVTFLMKKLKE